MNYETRQKITAQSLSEIQFERNNKEPKFVQWNKNEDLYYGKKIEVEIGQVNVNLNEMKAFVDTFVSKVNSKPDFTYSEAEEADTEKARIINALKERDRQTGMWDAKFLFAKPQLAMYGRAIFEYHADSINKRYQSHLTNVDVYNFLIDSSAGGLDIEQAYYLGRCGIYKTKKQLEDGVKSGIYLEEETKELLNADENVKSETTEERKQKNRYLNILGKTKQVQTEGVYKFWEWNTTFEGVRYTLLLTEEGGKAIQVTKHSELFESDKWQYFTWATSPDLTEFWSPSPADGVREAIIAQQLSINQAIQNSEEINDPVTYFDYDAIQDPELLVFRKNKKIPLKPGTDVNRAIQTRNIPSIQTPFMVYDKLSAITGVASGINAATMGVAEEDKVGIYEGNMRQAADRYAVLNDLEAIAQKRMAVLYVEGLDEHLTNEVAVDLIGLDGVPYRTNVSQKDIKDRSELDIEVNSSLNEEAIKGTEKRNKLTFLTNNKQNPIYNPKKLAEIEAQIVGFSQREIKELLDVKNYGDSELMAECAMDIQNIIKGRDVKLNQQANIAYAQKIIDFLKDEQDNLKADKVASLYAYLDQLTPIIQRNETQNINQILLGEGLPSLEGQSMGMEGQAVPMGQPSGQEMPTGAPAGMPQGMPQAEPISY